MSDSSGGGGGGTPLADAGNNSVRYYKRAFWSEENLKYAQPHYRLEKASRIINRIGRDRECSLLDVGCGPATMRRLLASNIRYFGADIAIQEPAPYLLEADLLEGPIRFGDRKFDIVLAQGFFEYVGEHQSQKFAEIVQILKDGGIFIATYVNFSHRDRYVYWPYSNVQSFTNFRKSLSVHFDVRKVFPSSYNWRHSEPSRRSIRDVNMHFNLNLPLVSPRLAVEYFVICRPRSTRMAPPGT